MDSVTAALAEWGCDVACISSRFMGNEAFYLQLMNVAAEDEAFAQLGRDIAAGDVSAAFESAHALKGVTGNMGLTPIYSLICKMVEPLRTGSLEGAAELYQELMVRYAKLLDILGRPSA